LRLRQDFLLSLLQLLPELQPKIGMPELLQLELLQQLLMETMELLLPHLQTMLSVADVAKAVAAADS
jgi:hypothetical protein